MRLSTMHEQLALPLGFPGRMKWQIFSALFSPLSQVFTDLPEGDVNIGIPLKTRFGDLTFSPLLFMWFRNVAYDL